MEAENRSIDTSPPTLGKDYSEPLVQLSSALTELNDALPRGQRLRINQAIKAAESAVRDLQLWEFLKLKND